MTESGSVVVGVCPVCQQQPAQAVASVFVVKGFLIWYQKGHVVYVGCVSCVRSALLGEVPKSLIRILLFPPGWLIVPALVIPFLLIHALMLKPEPDAVMRFAKGERPTSEAGSRTRVALCVWIGALALLAFFLMTPSGAEGL